MVDTIAITQEDLTRLQQNIIDSLKDEISNGNSGLEDEINDFKDTVIKPLQGENQNLRQKCNKLEAKIVSKLETEQNSLAHYERRKNIDISGIPYSFDDNNLENIVISMMPDINANIEENDIEACNRFGKPDQNLKRKLFVLSTGKVAIKFSKTKRNLQN